MANISERVDASFIGYILMGVVFLLVGVFGLQTGNLFGDDPLKWPTSIQVTSYIVFVAGVILLLLTVFAYRTGEKTSAGIFALFGFAFISMQTAAITGLIANSNWFVYIAFAILAIVLAIHVLLEGDPKMITLMLVVTAVMFFFMALSCYFDCIIPGPGNNADLFHAMGITYAVFAFIAFALTTYIGLARAHDDRVPLI